MAQRLVKAILICPFDRIVREVQLDANDFRDIYKYLTHELHPVDCFTAVPITRERDAIMVDDNGLLNDPKYFFLWKGYPQPLAGRGLVVGTNRAGETVATGLTAAVVMANVLFLEDIRVESMKTTTEEVDHPMLGKITRISTRPVFRSKKEG
jgi:hypothetical protein